MSQQRHDSDTSGYSTSASSEFGSLDERFKLPTMIQKNGTKRRAEEKIENLDEMMKSQLILSPEKRLRLQSSNDGNVSRRLQEEDPLDAIKLGRPPTRRSTSIDRIRGIRAPTTGSSIDTVRTVNAICSDSISPKLIGTASPRRRTENSGSVYSKHRLGATFSPLIAGGKKKVATPQPLRGGLTSRQSPLNSPRQGGLRSRGPPRGRPLLSDRFNLLD